MRRLLVGALLSATRVSPSLRERIVAALSALGQRHRALALRLYAPVLDYLYWCGVREAERGTTSKRAA